MFIEQVTVIDGKNVFDQPVKNYQRTYDRKFETGHRNYYTTSCLLHYIYFQSCYKMIATDLTKEQALNPDPYAMQQINFIGNLDREGNR